MVLRLNGGSELGGEPVGRGGLCFGVVLEDGGSGCAAEPQNPWNLEWLKQRSGGREKAVQYDS